MRLNKHECMGCGLTIPNSAVHYSSSVYRSPNGFLDEHCWRYEEQLIEDRGTNDIPELVHKYRSKKYTHDHDSVCDW